MFGDILRRTRRHLDSAPLEVMPKKELSLATPSSLEDEVAIDQHGVEVQAVVAHGKGPIATARRVMTKLLKPANYFSSTSVSITVSTFRI